MGLLSTAFRVHPSSVSEEAWEKGGFLLGGSPTYTGKAVTEESALEFTAVWSAVTQIAQDKAGLPLHLFKRLKPRGKIRWTSNPLYHLMHTQPNPEMTSMVYRERGMRDVLLWGNDYSEIVENEEGVITALWPLLPDKMIPKRVNGELFYFYSDPDGKTAIFTSRQILHIPGFGNGIMGYNVVNKGKQAIGIGQAIEEFSGLWFGNGARPGAIFEHPENLSSDAQDRLKSSWYLAQGGLSKSHRVAILEEGMKLKEYGVDPEKSQMILSKQFSINEIARLLNMPPHRLRDLTRATFSNIEHSDLEYAKYTLMPWAIRYEQGYNIKLLTPKQQKTLFFEHDMDGLLRGDIKSRYEAYSKGIQNAILSPNDVREKENMNPYDGGDEYVIQLNMQLMSEIGIDDFESDDSGQTEPPEGENENRSFEDNENNEDLSDCDCGCIDKIEHRAKKKKKRAKSVKGIERIRRSFIKPLTKTAQEVVNKETRAVKKAVKRFLFDVDEKKSLKPMIYEERGVSAFRKWMDSFYEQHAGFVEQKFKPILRTYQELVAREAGSVIGVEIGAGDLEKFFDETLESFVKRYIGSSSGQLESIVKDIPADELENMAIAINQRMDEWFVKRADKLAKDESVRFANSTARESWVVSGVTKFRWQTVSENCPFCNALNGRIVGVQKNFLNAGDVMWVSDSGWIDIKDKNGKFVEKGSPSTIPEATKVQALKTYGNRLHPPVHQGCDCQVVPSF